MAYQLHKFENTSALDHELADKAVAELGEATAKRGVGYLVVSGGRTPLTFFHELSQRELAWDKVVVLLADERWVSADHQDSNERLVRENLLINEAYHAKLVPLKNNAAHAAEGQLECERVLSPLGKFDLVILGMGNDGHTASLFPFADALGVGLDMQSGRSCVAVTPKDAPHERISLTLPRLLDTRNLIIHIVGDNKERVLDAALAGDDAKEMPVRAVLQQSRINADIYWAL